jgi:hypothetical protein
MNIVFVTPWVLGELLHMLFSYIAIVSARFGPRQARRPFQSQHQYCECVHGVKQ